MELIMINYKSFKWSYGLIFSLVCGLSGCIIYDNDDSTDYSSPTTPTTAAPASPSSKATNNADTANTSTPTATAPKSTPKEPMQVTAPGPKRAAAPQIPVIE
jgi:hypothetical protein